VPSRRSRLLRSLANVPEKAALMNPWLWRIYLALIGVARLLYYFFRPICTDRRHEHARHPIVYGGCQCRAKKVSHPSPYPRMSLRVAAVQSASVVVGCLEWGSRSRMPARSMLASEGHVYKSIATHLFFDSWTTKSVSDRVVLHR